MKTAKQIRNQVWDQVGSQVLAQGRIHLIQVRNHVLDQVWDQVWGEVLIQVFDQIREETNENS